MKAAVSIPDRVFREAERTAKRLGITRSRLYAQAVEAYLDALRRNDVTTRLNAAHGDSADRVSEDVVRAQSAVVAREDW